MSGIKKKLNCSNTNYRLWMDGAFLLTTRSNWKHGNKTNCYKRELCFFFFPSLWHFLSPVSVSPPWQGSSGSTTVQEQRSFERKAEEDDGKVSFLSTVSAASSSLPSSCFLSNDISVWEKHADQGGISRGCKAPEQMTPWGSGMRVCHHGDRQNDRHIEESVAVLPSVPTPSSLPSPHNLPGTHMLRFPSAERLILQLC